MRVYILKGSSGVWDQYSWLVRAFTSLQEAQNLQGKLSKEIFMFQNEGSPGRTQEEYDEALAKVCRKYDPNAIVFDSHLEYNIEECPLGYSEDIVMNLNFQ